MQNGNMPCTSQKFLKMEKKDFVESSNTYDSVKVADVGFLIVA